MPEEGKVLLVLENGGLREESIRLAFELAKRLACEVDALLLLGGDGEMGQDAADDALGGLAAAATEEGIGTVRAAKAGDPGSELLKHLATRGTPRVLVWAGSDSALRAARHPRKGSHWFIRVREQVHCPVVTATSRAKVWQAKGGGTSSGVTSRKP